MENNGEQFYKMMMEVKRAIGILEDVCEKLTLEYFKAKPPKIHTVHDEELDVFNSKDKQDEPVSMLHMKFD